MTKIIGVDSLARSAFSSRLFKGADHGGESLLVSADQVVVAPGGQPHKFTNTGAGRLRLISIAPSPTAITEWLPDRPA